MVMMDMYVDNHNDGAKIVRNVENQN